MSSYLAEQVCSLEQQNGLWGRNEHRLKQLQSGHDNSDLRKFLRQTIQQITKQTMAFYSH